MDDASRLARLDAAARLAASGDPAAVRAEIDGLGWLRPQLERDAARFEAWARSTVIDEHAGSAVLPRAVVDELHAIAGQEARFPVGNAGLLHVYGYLLSVRPTPFGLKRDRWIDGELAAAFGLPRTAFHPWLSGSTTLLDRVTDAAGTALAHPERALAAREAVLDDGRTLHAVLIRRPGTPAALVSGIDAGDGIRLVTAFPVRDPDAFLAELDDGPPRLRWNAV